MATERISLEEIAHRLDIIISQLRLVKDVLQRRPDVEIDAPDLPPGSVGNYPRITGECLRNPDE